jgi:hypothetical protein
MKEFIRGMMMMEEIRVKEGTKTTEQILKEPKPLKQAPPIRAVDPSNRLSIKKLLGDLEVRMQ